MALEAETGQIQIMESELKQLDLHIQNVESEKERVKEMIQKLEMKEKEATIAKLVAENQRLEQEISEATAISNLSTDTTIALEAETRLRRLDVQIRNMDSELKQKILDNIGKALSIMEHMARGDDNNNVESQATIAELVAEKQTLEQELSEVTAIKNVQAAKIAELVTENQTLEQELSEATAVVEEFLTICEKNNIPILLVEK